MEILYDRRTGTIPQVILYDGNRYYNVTEEYSYDAATDRYRFYATIYWGNHLAPRFKNEVDEWGYYVYMDHDTRAASGVAIPISEPFAQLDVLTLVVQVIL